MRSVYKALTEAAIDPNRWRPAVSAAVEFMGCSDAHLVSYNKKEDTFSENMFLNAQECVSGWYQIYDKCEALDFMLKNPRYLQFTDHDILDEDSIKKSEFYNWADKYNAKYRICLRLIDSDSADGAVAFLKSGSQGLATEEDLKRLSIIAPQFRLAAQVSNALTGSTVHLDRLVESLETARTAALVMDDRGVVAFANKLARSILRKADGITYVNTKVNLSTSRARGRLSQLVIDAVQASLTNDMRRPGGRLAVPRPSGLPPYQIIISGLPPTYPFLDMRKPWVLALIIDPAALGTPTADILAQGYHLTPVEADIGARFATGSTLEMIAEERGVTLGTIRVQFKTVMGKMGVRRQADLMRLLTLLSRPRGIDN